jgi:hypothetical protein
MIPRVSVFLALCWVAAFPGISGRAGEIRASGDAELRTALGRLEPGATVLIAPGSYRGGLYVSGAAGTPERRITIRGADPARPPVFSGGKEALHLADCSYLTLADLEVRGCTSNGINVDDGGTKETPSRGVVIENVKILDTGPEGNHDALKMSGVDGFTVRGCTFSGWGGSGIDMVGCHDGVVEKCRFEGKPGFSQSNAVQMKGGTARILVHMNFFRDAGQRGINLGGSTGLQYFRPEVGDCEAREITVAGNRFAGGLCALAWVTADGGRVHHNTIYLPEKWVLRVLQETSDGKFKPCRAGVFERNLVVFDRRVSTFVNVGPGTQPESFVFRENAWFEAGGSRRPQLPVEETGSVCGVDPKIEKPGTAEMRATEPKVAGYGADAYRPPDLAPKP